MADYNLEETQKVAHKALELTRTILEPYVKQIAELEANGKSKEAHEIKAMLMTAMLGGVGFCAVSMFDASNPSSEIHQLINLNIKHMIDLFSQSKLNEKLAFGQLDTKKSIWD